MKRFAAPSRKFKTPIKGLSDTSKTVSKENISSNTTKNNQHIRSTLSILNIINSANDNDSNPVLESKTVETENEAIGKENIIEENTGKKLYSILWRKKTGKKHKTWEGDGFLELENRNGVVKDSDGVILGRLTKMKIELIEDGYIFSLGNRDVQVGDFINSSVAINSGTKRSNTDEEDNKIVTPSKKQKIEPAKFYSLHYNLSTKRKTKSLSSNYQPLVMPEPSADHQWKYNSSLKPVTEISVDPCLVKVLRPHQRQGIVFLYECVMGFKNSDYFGAILADEMGLGKTLQCITLIWTLLKKGPYGNTPLYKKILIVTPSSLVGNWEREFSQWLGHERIQVFLVDSKNKPKDFVKYPKIPILIISYDMFVRYSEDISEMNFDLLICDEGHRLKNNNIKAAVLLNQLDCKRRIILTGTPIQNDLHEFYSLVDFVNPGILDTNFVYKKYFEDPIIASREFGVDEELKLLGEERAKELSKKTNNFILRRTQEILDKYLPTKTEVVIFCKSSLLQQNLYSKAVELWENRDIPAKELNHLSVITTLKKICNHPKLLGETNSDSENLSSRLCEFLPEKLSIFDSGKIKILVELLRNLERKKERIVIVSLYTQTLDLIEDICKENSYKFCRLDGSVATGQRSKIVENFNNKYSIDFVFLLSAKAGGVGLNLVGANRLVLFDSDWNPATDLQAMARIWRDGQKKSVYLYRFVTTGTIEEKIYQRQISKTDLSSTIVDPCNKTTIRLSDEELKDLFCLQFDADSSTHDILNCVCACNGEIPEPKMRNQDDERKCQLGIQKNDENSMKNNLRMNELMQWEHYKSPIDKDMLIELGFENVGNDITFIFRNKCSLE